MLPTQPHSGELSNENGDSNESSKETTGLDSKKNNFAHVSCFFVHFLVVTA